MRIILGIGFAAITSIGFYLFVAEVSGIRTMFFVIGAAALGYYLPAFSVSLRIADRRRQFRLGVPDGLDMLLVGVEAGLSLPAAMKHIVEEFAESHPIVAEQFQIVVLEFQAGRSRADALHNLSTRMNIPETRMLASMMVQSETLGTSLAQTLRVMADELRAQRMLEAEKKASELPVKMAFPLVLCIFPAVLSVALVPAMLQVLNEFSVLGK